MRVRSGWADRIEKTLLLLFGTPGDSPAPPAPPAMGGGGMMPADFYTPARRCRTWCAYGAERLQGRAEVRRIRAGGGVDGDEDLLLLILAVLI